MENKNLPAFPISSSSNETGTYSLLDARSGFDYIGLTKREWMAAHVDVSNEMVNSSIAFIEALMGKQPPSSHLENFAYWNEAEAKLRVMKADALIAELSKPQP